MGLVEHPPSPLGAQPGAGHISPGSGSPTDTATCSATIGATCGAPSTRCSSVPPAWRRWLYGALDTLPGKWAPSFRRRWAPWFSLMHTSSTTGLSGRYWTRCECLRHWRGPLAPARPTSSPQPKVVSHRVMASTPPVLSVYDRDAPATHHRPDIDLPAALYGAQDFRWCR